MASSHRRRHHVFPSFCGEDVRRNFLSHFHKELQLHGIDAFNDGGIKRSRSIWPELKQAIWESRVSIVVLSKNYGGSSWCLDELVEIMERREVAGQTVMPIFYGVDPSDVRKQSGDFGKAFDKICHVRTEEERQRWSQALTIVANKALIVLDDVDGLEQLNALVDKTEWFGNGTRIIITTEDRQILKAHGISHVYEVGYPSQGEAFKILCRNAFGKNSAPKGFYDLATEVAELAGDLPLGLSVLGASLRGMSREEWINAIPRLRTSLNGKIEKLLGVCYDGLDEKDKSLFLHVACLFNGEKADRVKQLLAKSALDAEFGLKVLVDRSLMHIYDDGCIVMHFLLQQMGKEIIRGEGINDPGGRQFLVDAQEISDVLVDETGTKNVLGISLDMSELDDEVYISEKAFEKMTNLQFLRLYNHLPDEAVKLYLPHGLDYLPRKLRLLHWDSYPIKCMPSKFRPELLVELTLRDSKLEKLWEGAQPLTSLIHMDLSASKNIKDIPNLSRATNLEKLYLRLCENLVTVSTSSLQNLNKLKVLDMSCCVKLKDLPTNINLESLSVLNLRGCSKLKRFPCISTQVQFMSLGETAIEKVPSLVKLCSRLVALEMAGCKNLKALPLVPASIEILDLSKTGVEFIYVDHMHVPFICLFGDSC